MYGKHFQSTYTGSMYGAGADVFAVWGYIIAHTVKSQIELNPAHIGPILGMPPMQVTEAIDYLCRPDPSSRTKEEDGRRLVKDGQFSYFVVTHALYRNIRNADDKREHDRERQRKHREKSQEPTTTTEPAKAVHKTNGEAKAPTIPDADVLIEKIRAIGSWRYAGSQAAESSLVDQLAAGADPDELYKALCRIHVWTEEGKYAPRLREVIERWREPAELWTRTAPSTKPVAADVGKNEFELQHGVNCPKEPHTEAVMYEHEEADNGPFTLEGSRYCGRCHEVLP